MMREGPEENQSFAHPRGLQAWDGELSKLFYHPFGGPLRKLLPGS